MCVCGGGEEVGSYEGERWKCGKMQRKGEGGGLGYEHGKWELGIRMWVWECEHGNVCMGI